MAQDWGVSIPQAVWIACNIYLIMEAIGADTCFNTASGMDCMQFPSAARRDIVPEVSIPQAVWIACNIVKELDKLFKSLFQYRKRYGLHAIWDDPAMVFSEQGFNTASGMDCMQFQPCEVSKMEEKVSIPQAVWIACNV